MTDSFADLWHQVAESPDDLAPRLVLADALIEAGDPRGELIVLQCGGADASVLVGRDDSGEPINVAERVNELIATHWETWLGDLALVIHRQGSVFRDGMLSLIQVGSEDPVPEALWESFGAHRELAVVRQVRPRKIRGDCYGRFLAALAHDPPYVELRAGSIATIRERRSRWSVRTLHCSGVTMRIDSPTADLVVLAELAPDLERLELGLIWFPREEVGDLATTIGKLPQMFPKLHAIKLEDAARLLVNLDARQVARLRAMPILELA